MYFALATFYEKDKPDISQEYYVKANKEVSEIQRLSMMKFQKSVGRVTDNYEALNDINITNANKGSNNIFIVGMPRSGTTLTESLITANSEVFGGGELMSFYDLSYKFLIEKDFSMSCCESVGDNYIRRTNYFLTKYKVVADKLPNNYHFIGHIRKFLPSAKIILLLRNPWDLAVSLFKQRYVTNIPFASSFFNIGIQMANFEACVLYWKKMGALDNNNVMTIHYEELVKNFDAYQGKIYDFCEIISPYEPKKREKFFAKTASINQVQNKVHTESLKKQDFSILKSEFIDALRSQREFWKYKKIAEIPDDFFGYSLE